MNWVTLVTYLEDLGDLDVRWAIGELGNKLGNMQGTTGPGVSLTKTPPQARRDPAGGWGQKTIPGRRPRRGQTPKLWRGEPLPPPHPGNRRGRGSSTLPGRTKPLHGSCVRPCGRGKKPNLCNFKNYTLSRNSKKTKDMKKKRLRGASFWGI